MKVSGCCIVKDAVKYDYPVVEAIKSVLPLCDEFIAGVGKSDDGTLELVGNIPGVTVFESEWDENMRKGGEVLSQETNKVIARCSGDWIFNIQADEVVHERTLPAVKDAIRRYFSVPGVEGLLFDYIHFYGSYDVYQKSFAWYPHEIRAIRGNSGISSQGDAKGFRIGGKKLAAARSGGVIHHYGWVRSPEEMFKKKKAFYRFWHDDSFIEKNFVMQKEHCFWDRIWALGIFKGTHPAVMSERIKKSSLRGCPSGIEKKSNLSKFWLSVVNFMYRAGIMGSKNYRLY